MDITKESNMYKSNLYEMIGESLYLNAETADFFFKMNDEQVAVHKCLLSAGSKVFEDLFNETWKDKNEVRITDCTIEGLKEFLQFFYLLRVKLTMENIQDVMKLGKKYDVSDCLNACAKFLKNNLTENDIFFGYEFSISIEHNDLQRFCEMMIASNATAILNSIDFVKCSRQILAKILSVDSLSCPEIDVFEACMNWTRQISGQNLTRDVIDTHLGDLFYKIRFGTMSNIELASLIPSYGDLFSVKEYQQIIQMTAMEEFIPEKFIAKRRTKFGMVPFVGESLISCYRILSKNLSTEPYFIKNIEITIFTTNETFLLYGFHCTTLLLLSDIGYVGLEGIGGYIPTNVTITEISLLKYNKPKVIGTLYGAKMYEEGSTAKINPVFIRPGYQYEIRFEQTVPLNCCTGHELRPNMEMTSDITVTFHNDPNIELDTKVTRGIICGFIFDTIF